MRQKALKSDKALQRSEFMRKSTAERERQKFEVDKERIKRIKKTYTSKILMLKRKFLSDSTFQGLRITITSTIKLSKHLLEKEGFEYVLTRKFNQDCLEVSKRSNIYFPEIHTSITKTDLILNCRNFLVA